MELVVSDSDLQTFPPSGAQGKISKASGPPRDADGTILFICVFQLMNIINRDSRERERERVTCNSSGQNQNNNFGFNCEMKAASVPEYYILVVVY